jgi:hypothetical protein
MRLIQLIGLSSLIGEPQNRTILLLLFFWVLFILAVSGPVASPRYRLPIEPALMVLAGAGFYRLGLWRHKNSAV